MKDVYKEDFGKSVQEMYPYRQEALEPSAKTEMQVSYDLSFGEKPEWSRYYYEGAEKYVEKLRDIYPHLKNTAVRVSYVLPELSTMVDGDFVVGSVVNTETKEEEEEVLTNKTVFFETHPEEKSTPLFYETNKIELDRPVLDDAEWLQGRSIFSWETLFKTLTEWKDSGMKKVRMAIPNERNGRGQVVLDLENESIDDITQKANHVLNGNTIEQTGLVLMENLQPIALDGFESSCVLQLSLIRKNLPDGQNMFFLSVANPSETSAYLGAKNIATLNDRENLSSPEALEKIEKILTIQRFPEDVRAILLKNMNLFWDESDSIINQLPGKSHYRVNTELTIGRNSHGKLALGYTDLNSRIGGASHGAIENVRELTQNPEKKLSLSQVNKRVGRQQDIENNSSGLPGVLSEPLQCYPDKGEDGHIQIFAGLMTDDNLQEEYLVHSAQTLLHKEHKKHKELESESEQSEEYALPA